MKLALITAPNGFKIVEFYGLAYHLVLAQKVLEDPEYAAFYRNRHRIGHYIILDNGEAEGEKLDLPDLLLAARRVGADEIVMPDTQRDRRETVHQFYMACGEIPRRQRFAVPQGNSWSEWMECVYRMLSTGVRTIGIAKLYEDYSGGRAHALRVLADMGAHLDVDIHLLGCYENPLVEVVRAQRMGIPIRGIDTAAPIAHAQCHPPIGMQDVKQHHSYLWGGAYDETTATSNTAEMIAQCTSY